MRHDIYDAMAAQEDLHWWFVSRRKILSAAIGRLNLPHHACILEVGAGTGGNTAMLQGHGQVVLLEPNEQARAYILQKTGETALSGMLPDTSTLTDQMFDLIVVFDVLEHIEDDQGTIQALVHHLRPGGYLMISVPAFPALWSVHDEVHHHQRRYTKAQLVEVVGAAGVRVVSLGYFNTLLFPIVASMRLLQRLQKTHRFDQDRLPNPVLNQILMYIFGAEWRLASQGRLPIGLSLLLVATKLPQ